MIYRSKGAAAQAVIDGRLYKLGDELFGGERVLAINANSVTLVIGRDQRNLYLTDDKGIVDTEAFDEFSVKRI